MKKKIYYHDTDAGGVVYYANYLKYFEEARTEFLAEQGVSVKDLADSGTLFVVARVEIEYKSPSFYADILEIDTEVTGTTGVRIEFQHEAKNQKGQFICRAKTTLVCVDKTLKPKQIPPELGTPLISKLSVSPPGDRLPIDSKGVPPHGEKF